MERRITNKTKKIKDVDLWGGSTKMVDGERTKRKNSVHYLSLNQRVMMTVSCAMTVSSLCCVTS